MWMQITISCTLFSAWRSLFSISCKLSLSAMTLLFVLSENVFISPSFPMDSLDREFFIVFPSVLYVIPMPLDSIISDKNPVVNLRILVIWGIDSLATFKILCLWQFDYDRLWYWVYPTWSLLNLCVCFSSNLQNFKALFLKMFFPPLCSPPSATPIMHLLVYLMVSHRFQRLLIFLLSALQTRYFNWPLLKFTFYLLLLLFSSIIYV